MCCDVCNNEKLAFVQMSQVRISEKRAPISIIEKVINPVNRIGDTTFRSSTIRIRSGQTIEVGLSGTSPAKMDGVWGVNLKIVPRQPPLITASFSPHFRISVSYHGTPSITVRLHSIMWSHALHA